jgi:two-component system KDP operon response regulator KdpE
MFDHSPPGQSDRSKLRVLVVDREESIRAFLRMALSDEGYEVMECRNLQVALYFVNTFQPHVILLDIFSPDSNEQIFLDDYRRMPGPHAPILGMTTSRIADGQADRLGIAELLPKPFDLTYLIARMGTLLGPRSNTPETRPGFPPQNQDSYVETGLAK